MQRWALHATLSSQFVSLGRRLNAIWRKSMNPCFLLADERAARSELRGGGRTHRVRAEHCRAADKILKGRCGCSIGLINSRKFPLNPVCWGSKHRDAVLQMVASTRPWPLIQWPCWHGNESTLLEYHLKEEILDKKQDPSPGRAGGVSGAENIP